MTKRNNIETKKISLEGLEKFGIDTTNVKNIEELLADGSKAEKTVDRIARCVRNEILENMNKEAKDTYNKVIDLFIKLQNKENISSSEKTIELLEKLETAIIDFGKASHSETEILALPLFSSEVGFDLHLERECAKLLIKVKISKEDIKNTRVEELRKIFVENLVQYASSILRKCKNRLIQAREEFEQIKKEDEKVWDMEKIKIDSSQKQVVDKDNFYI